MDLDKNEVKELRDICALALVALKSCYEYYDNIADSTPPIKRQAFSKDLVALAIEKLNE